eukprot:CAMPEP_0168165010 /NCGR_PEP_ID=MMETSP0139_2-20121125/1251_1 /TAXON_ID=44445 /ORGANISM="Pseudo-nitzschia australis, Strain 10249 10 AB" /LENGTH=505 /DNA_ID=CAMNT_0008082083 /DNA_START=3497 /DNA_END=5011 /DNA_ORIENTATION=-
MATRRNVGNPSSRQLESPIVDQQDKASAEIGIGHYDSTSSNGKRNKWHLFSALNFRANPRVLSRRASTIQLSIAILVVSIASLILRLEFNIIASDMSSTNSIQQGLLSDQNHHSGSENEMALQPLLFNASVPETKINDVTEGSSKESQPLIANQQNDKGSNSTTTNNNNSMEKELEINLTIDDPPIFEAPIVNPNTKDFDPSIPGVVVTKIQGSSHLRVLKQMLCLFTKAYNDRANRDIIVFTSEELELKEIEELEEIVSPAKLIVEVDNPGLHTMVEKLSPKQKTHLFERCNVNSTSELTWYTKCSEVSSYSTLKGERIAYNWQAEFRALWMWTRPVLAPYKYLMWMDSDVFCTRIWNQDPIARIERHDLALLFDHFPQGYARGKEFPERTKQAFDRIICGITMINGTLVARDGRCLRKTRGRIAQVHGFFHVSSLDFYRSDAVMKWNRALIGDSKFSRVFDDQIGITIPAAVLAGNRSRNMRSIGVYPRVMHNYVIDGMMQDW